MKGCVTCQNLIQKLTRCHNRDHVARHFGAELDDIIMAFDDPNQCTQCPYKSDKLKNVAIHVALGHQVRLWQMLAICLCVPS